MIYELRNYGPHAALLDFGNSLHGAGLAAAAARLLRRHIIFVEVVPAFSEVLLAWRPVATATAVRRVIAASLKDLAPAATADVLGTLHTLEAVYDGPDLDSVAAQCNRSASEVVRLHQAATYRVGAVGFQPGFAYLVGLPTALRLPRRSEIRSRVPAGSLAIATEYTAVYPHVSPGGWWLIGRVIAAGDSPRSEGVSGAGLCVADRVRFVAASEKSSAP